MEALGEASVNCVSMTLNSWEACSEDRERLEMDQEMHLLCSALCSLLCVSQQMLLVRRLDCDYRQLVFQMSRLSVLSGECPLEEADSGVESTGPEKQL